MLARLEETYLNVLRVAIVVVAGLALLAAASALAAGIFNGSKSLLSSTLDAEAGRLAEFVAEKKLAAEVAGDVPAGTGPEQTRATMAVSPSIEQAAASFAQYLNRRDRRTITRDELVQQLNELWLTVPDGHQHSYDKAVLDLAGELAGSTGRPLSRDRVLELLQWHHQSFVGRLGQLEQERAAASASAWMWIERAAQAFLLFIAIAFYFLFVRVERHLRLVRTQPAEPAAASLNDPGAAG
ncbi:MAG TPA: hypothetical protein VF662_02075 [Allosphingosinicella sp.]